MLDVLIYAAMALVAFLLMLRNRWRLDSGMKRPAAQLFNIVLSLYILRIGIVRIGLDNGKKALYNADTWWVQILGSPWILLVSTITLAAVLLWRFYEEDNVRNNQHIDAPIGSGSSSSTSSSDSISNEVPASTHQPETD